MVPKLERRLRSPSVVAEQLAEPLTTLDRTGTAEVVVAPVIQPVVDSLMVPFEVVVLNVLADDSPNMAFAERNRLADAL